MLESRGLEYISVHMYVLVLELWGYKTGEVIRECHSSNLKTFVQTVGWNCEAGEGPS